jgi:CTP synthase (UTP-ammonia lyase)
MKKQVVLMMVAAIFSLTTVSAQGGGGGQRQTPEERTKAIMEKMVALNLDAAATTKTETVIAEFNNAQQKSMEEMRASGNMDREAMMAKRKELTDARDAKLKAIFTEEQMKKWKDEIEPSMRRPRGNGQGPANK